MTGLVAGMGTKAVLSAAGARLGQISPKVWLALGCVLCLILGALWHHHEVKKHDVAIIAANNAQWQKKLDAQAAAMKAKDAQLAAMSAQIRKANDEQNRAIAADAAAQRMSGPGKATCPGVPRATSPSGGSVAPGRPGNAPVAPLSGAGGQQLIALPFDDALDFSADHDSDRAENLSWRTWYANLVANWPKNAKP